MTCEEFKDIAGAFALGATTLQESLEARAHLQSCPSCTRDWQELRAIVDLLPLSVTPVSPRAAVKEQILTQVRNEPRQGSVTPKLFETRKPQRLRKADMGRLWLAAAAILLLCLFVGMSVWNLGLRGQIASQEQQLATLAQRNSVLAQQANTLQKQITLTFPIQGLKDLAGAAGKLLYIPPENLTIVTIQGLPKLQGSQVYQGWLIHNQQTTSIGLLFMQNGIASLTYHGTIANFDVAAISLEPGPAASINAPVGPVIATGQLQAHK